MANPKILGTKYGITITKPWSKEMYDHNDAVAEQMKEAIFKALNSAYNRDDEEELRYISKAICSHGHGLGYGLDEIHADACLELERVPNYWLNEWCWPDLLKRQLVDELSIGFVGYDK